MPETPHPLAAAQASAASTAQAEVPDDVVFKFKDRSLSGIVNNCALNGALPTMLAYIEALAKAESSRKSRPIEPELYSRYEKLKELFIKEYKLSSDLTWNEFQQLIENQRDNFFLIQLLFAPILRQYLVDIEGTNGRKLNSSFAVIKSDDGRYQALASDEAARLYNHFGISLYTIEEIPTAGRVHVTKNDYQCKNPVATITLRLSEEHFDIERPKEEQAAKKAEVGNEKISATRTVPNIDTVGSSLEHTNDVLGQLKSYIQHQYSSLVAQRPKPTPTVDDMDSGTVVSSKPMEPALKLRRKSELHPGDTVISGAPVKPPVSHTDTKGFYIFGCELTAPSSPSEFNRKAVPLDVDQSKDFTSEKGIDVYASAGSLYHFSYKDGVPTTRLAAQTIKTEEERERLALTVINMIDNVLAKSSVVHVDTKDPIIAAIANEYIEKLKNVGITLSHKIILNNAAYKHEDNSAKDTVKQTMEKLKPVIEKAERTESDDSKVPKWRDEVRKEPVERNRIFREQMEALRGVKEEVSNEKRSDLRSEL